MSETLSYEQQIIKAVKKVLPAVVSVIVSEDFEKFKGEVAQLPKGPIPLDQYQNEKEMMENIPRTKDGRVKI